MVIATGKMHLWFTDDQYLISLTETGHMTDPTRPKTTADVAPVAPTKEAEVVNRRRMFGAGLISIGTMLAAACSGTDFASGVAGGRKKDSKQAGGVSGDDDDDSTGPDGTAPGGKDAADGVDPNNPDDPNNPNPPGPTDPSIDDCAANNATAISPDGDPADAYQARFKFYGKTKSALVAVQFDASESIDQVILATPTGRLIAVHTITGADKDASGKYRPIVMDNVWLQEKGKDLTEIKLILQTPAGKKVHTEPVAFFTTYNNMTVVDLSGGSVPSEMLGNQSVTQFDASSGGFDTDTSVSYPSDAANGNQVRNLHTVNISTSWTRGAGVKGTVTDIMGVDITSKIDGQGILEHQVFCTYVNIAGNKTVRTILHIG